MERSIRTGKVVRVDGAESSQQEDFFAIEEPLEVSIRYGPVVNRNVVVIAVIMRTPGEDDLLAMGFCFSEQILFRFKDVLSIRYGEDENKVLLELRADVKFDPARFSRHVYSTSSCGICGKTSIDHIHSSLNFPFSNAAPQVSREQVMNWPSLLSKHQRNFQSTGGMHASCLVGLNDGKILLFEDVGRHSALDKLIGYALKEGLLPLKHSALMLSGRVSFELVQKAAMAGIPIVAAKGAPSSLAVELSQESGQTLIGFVKESGFNIYTGSNRILA